MWTCPTCKNRWNENKQRCCGRKRPWRKPSHAAVLKEMPYEEWVDRYGDTCNICGASPKTVRLNRDHDHARLDAPRGLLCARCNRVLHNWMSPEWLRKAADYLDRTSDLNYADRVPDERSS